MENTAVPILQVLKIQPHIYTWPELANRQIYITWLARRKMTRSHHVARLARSGLRTVNPRFTPPKFLDHFYLSLRWSDRHHHDHSLLVTSQTWDPVRVLPRSLPMMTYFLSFISPQSSHTFDYFLGLSEPSLVVPPAQVNSLPPRGSPHLSPSSPHSSPSMPSFPVAIPSLLVLSLAALWQNSVNRHFSNHHHWCLPLSSFVDLDRWQPPSYWIANFWQ